MRRRDPIVFNRKPGRWGNRIIGILIACLLAILQGCIAIPAREARKTSETRSTKCAMLYHRAKRMHVDAERLLQSGDKEAAAEKFRIVLDQLEQIEDSIPGWEPGATDPLKERASSVLKEIDAALRVKDSRTAMAHARFNEQHLADPGSSLPFVELGDHYFAEELYQKALKFYLEALRRNLTSTEIQMRIALIFSRTGNYERAIALYRGLISAGLEMPLLYYNLGGVYLRDNKPRQAIRCYKKSLELDPANPETHNALGIVCKQLERYSEAITHFKDAIRLNPGDPSAHYNLGLTFMAQNNYPTALNYLNRAKTLFGSDHPMTQRITDSMEMMHRYR